MKPKSNRKPGPMDNCQTPPYAIKPLIDWIWMSSVSTIWEPAAGEGILARALEKNGFNLVCSDIDPAADITYGQVIDFLTEETSHQYETIVTNPPFSQKFEWLERCYTLGKGFALLLPLETLGAARAQDLFDMYGVAVLLMSPRVDFKMPDAGWMGGGAQFPVAWFLGGYLIEDDERNRFFIHRLDKTSKHELHELDEAGKL